MLVPHSCMRFSSACCQRSAVNVHFNTKPYDIVRVDNSLWDSTELYASFMLSRSKRLFRHIINYLRFDSLVHQFRISFTKDNTQIVYTRCIDTMLSSWCGQQMVNTVENHVLKLDSPTIVYMKNRNDTSVDELKMTENTNWHKSSSHVYQSQVFLSPLHTQFNAIFRTHFQLLQLQRNLTWNTHTVYTRAKLNDSKYMQLVFTIFTSSHSRFCKRVAHVVCDSHFVCRSQQY